MNPIRILMAVIAIMILTSTAQAACYSQFGPICPTTTVDQGDRTASAGPGDGCTFAWTRLRCKGGPQAARDGSDGTNGWTELGEKCGLADRESWSWDGLRVSANPEFHGITLGTNMGYCIPNILAIPVQTGTDVDFARCGEKVVAGTFGPCRPRL